MSSKSSLSTLVPLQTDRLAMDAMRSCLHRPPSSVSMTGLLLIRRSVMRSAFSRATDCQSVIRLLERFSEMSAGNGRSADSGKLISVEERKRLDSYEVE